MFNLRSAYMVVWAILLWLTVAHGMRDSLVKELRQETERMFFHGFENYLQYAFPEDELRALTCGPLVRDEKNPENNDVLGNYSLTLIDSLSTLAILSSSPDSGEQALAHFQDGVESFVRLYGDGSDGPAGQGERSRGFDLDSKVQLFETVIRGLGGLLSAHLFAVGELPITGYEPSEREVAFASAWDKSMFMKSDHGIQWSNGFVYDGQLLRLAVDLAQRLLPAFYTETGLPYPRVNLRHGIPFYENAPLNLKVRDSEGKRKSKTAASEPAETCSAGAGSLVLELTVLSRLTGDGRYEDLGKRAFWAVWNRRSDIGLLGFGIDVESGKWVGPWAGIGAGIDSFYEYAVKTYVLLSEGERVPFDSDSPWAALDSYYAPLTDYQHTADAFRQVWEESHTAINRHLFRGEGYQHPHLIVGDVVTGATRAFWIDSLSAFYPGVLALDGKLDEAIQIHLLTTAIWTRYSGIPERWNVATGDIDNGMPWYGGRPEFIESNYYIYRATQDPWYLHVGEMVLSDLKRRCWTKCGWAGIRNVLTGELIDRMESFFIGETAKYLYLLFDRDHPLNKIDAPWVFNTEGHPLIIPRKPASAARQQRTPSQGQDMAGGVCQIIPSPFFGVSSTASRTDIFHAANLARLDLMPDRGVAAGPILEDSPGHQSVFVSDLSSPTNYTFYPWTLPPQLVPFNGTSAPMAVRPTLDISFPSLPGGVNMGPGALERVRDGVLVKTIGGLRLSLVQDVRLEPPTATTGDEEDGYRVQVINNVPLGKDEKSPLADVMIRLIHEMKILNQKIHTRQNPVSEATASPLLSTMPQLLTPRTQQTEPAPLRLSLPAAISTGIGSSPLPDIEDAVTMSLLGGPSTDRLSWSSIYFAGELCDERILRDVAHNHEVLVIKRGGCTFSEKLRNIPAYRPTRSALKLIVVVSYDDIPPRSFREQKKEPTNQSGSRSALAAVRAESTLVRPHLDEAQMTASGIPRNYLISMVMVGGGDETYELLRHASGIGVKRRYSMRSRGVPITNLHIV
ncbi:CAZyme family GH47 [Penicillium roqueforti]|uniref:CAZyme family GH47 n=1 Tax=Penicillium roqueforti TaxID=5082 RepID=UPI0019090905|nr:CAZyme family GH47 [Penicillium roqueforti]KAF9244325.1 CAZyme family GH47 [Penicillium roqueforti]KAI1835906.1 CAZyme family GH47 [Penicillium roqueforti]KAI2682928.1 CAZyme family GH47 [Penicillium roqueforti]KAI2701497.1 CAZyme family GH47 [Penicillium roqueforti]KAI2717346.1 CAZyme family GH47 [Penicillium roqueforti]